MAEAKLKFEEALAKLEKLVGEMESGDLPLDAMMARFEEGRSLVALCSGELEAVRGRIEKVVSAATEPTRVEALDAKEVG